MKAPLDRIFGVARLQLHDLGFWEQGEVRTHIAVGWTQLVFNWKFFCTCLPALPLCPLSLWVCVHIPVYECEPCLGSCCCRGGFLPRKGADVLFGFFPVSCPACGSPPTWSPPAPWSLWSGWMCSLPLGRRCLTMSCSTRRWMNTRTQTSTQVGAAAESKLLLVQRVHGDASCAWPGWELLVLWGTVHRAKVLYEVSKPLHSGEVSEGFCRHGYLRGRGNTKMQHGRRKLLALFG